jgi:5-methylcytosine-specific restriction endonuclease McrA
LKADKQATEARRFEDESSFVFKDGRERLVGLDWKMRVDELRERSGGRCEALDTISAKVGELRCWQEAVDPHHIIPRSKGRDDRLSNLQALCRYHHDLLDNRKVRSDRAKH